MHGVDGGDGDKGAEGDGTGGVLVLKVSEGIDDVVGCSGMGSSALGLLVGAEDGRSPACELREVEGVEHDGGLGSRVEGLEEVDDGGDVLLIVDAEEEAEGVVGLEVLNGAELGGDEPSVRVVEELDERIGDGRDDEKAHQQHREVLGANYLHKMYQM